MYIKLTRLDNSPIWINASFIFTIEPLKGGGSIVVPIGDGLDYDVKESTERVLSLLEGAPVAPVVPVPAPKLLAKKPYYAANPPPPEPSKPGPPPQSVPSKPSPAAEPSTSKPETVPQAAVTPPATEPPPKSEPQDPAPVDGAETPSAAEQPVSEPPAEQQPEAMVDVEPPPETLLVEVEESGKKKPARSRTKTSAKKPRATRSKAKKPALDLSEEQVERLVKMAPGSIRKLQNTLVTQFKVVDAEETVKALEAHGVLAVDHDHIVWSAKAEASPAEAQG